MYTMAVIPSTVGFHWEEVFVPYFELKEAGWRTQYYTVDGKPPVADPKSIKIEPIFSYLGAGINKERSPQSIRGQELTAQLNTAKNISELAIEPIDAIYIPGGHGCLFDVTQNPLVHQIILAAYEQKKLIAAVCHGTSALAFVKQKEGHSIIKGRKIIGFLDIIDDIAKPLRLIDKKFLPLPYRNEQKLKEAGADIPLNNELLAFVNPAFHVTDLPFITGVGPKAAGSVAREVIHVVQEKQYR